ncbi:MAG TPA: hypothetical protein IGS52_19895 [Oscillatoriaceae cyanobacterium M33_DOE_052]|nr:hypothetical protein [Oscillatoriaceae cyanobacterium M33_DOE_052]
MTKVNNFLFAIGSDPQGYQHSALLSPGSGLVFEDHAIEDQDLILILKGPSMIGIDCGIQLFGHSADRLGTEGFS